MFKIALLGDPKVGPASAYDPVRIVLISLCLEKASVVKVMRRLLIFLNLKGYDNVKNIRMETG